MDLVNEKKKLEETLKSLIEKQEQLNQLPAIQKYLEIEKQIQSLLKKMDMIQNRIQYSEKANCYYTKPEIGSGIYIKGTQRINLSMILARIFIEKYKAQIEKFDLISLEELERYSQIVHAKLTEEKCYEDDPRNEEVSKMLQIPIYVNPANNISYIFNNDSQSKKVLKEELERYSHDIAENINTKYYDQGYIVLNRNALIETLTKKYSIENASSRIKEALSSSESLKALKIKQELPKKKVYHQ